MTPEQAWYASNGCDHAHCPVGCDKPQPRTVSGVLVCGKCLVINGVWSEMIPCTPAACEEAKP